MPPSRRNTARVLPVKPDGAVLLLHELDPACPERPYWSTIGGGVEAGETVAEAAVRELLEETGIVVAREALLGPVHELEHGFMWNRIERLAHHTYFAVALTGTVEVSRDGLQPEEIDTVLGAAWWTPRDLAEQVFVEPRLPDIMQTAIDAVEGAR